MNMNPNMMGAQMMGGQMMGAPMMVGGPMMGGPRGGERKPCRYFSNGVCRFGDNCNFAHDANRRQPTVCRYFLMGNCTYGDRCFYQHSAQAQMPGGMAERTQSAQPTMDSVEIQAQQMETN